MQIVQRWRFSFLVLYWYGKCTSIFVYFPIYAKTKCENRHKRNLTSTMCANGRSSNIYYSCIEEVYLKDGSNEAEKLEGEDYGRNILRREWQDLLESSFIIWVLSS